MKRIFLSVSMVALLATGAFAQSISGGIKVGANITNMKMTSGDDSESGDSKIGFHAGAYLNAMITDKFGIQPELLYSAMGTKDGDLSLNADYLSVPVMLRYNVAENISIQAGPQAGFLLSAKAKFDGESGDAKDLFKSIDFGASFGVGIDFGKINASARYYLGLASVASDDYVEMTELDDFKWKNNGIQFSLGYKLFGE